MTIWTKHYNKRKKLSLGLEEVKESQDSFDSSDFEWRHSPMHGHVHTVKMLIHGHQDAFSDPVKTMLFGDRSEVGINLIADSLTYGADRYDMQLWHPNLANFSTLRPNTISGANIVLVVARTPETLAQLLRQANSAMSPDQVLCVAVEGGSTNNLLCTKAQIQAITAAYPVKYIELDLGATADTSSLLTALTDQGYAQMREALVAIDSSLAHGRVPNRSLSSTLSSLGSSMDSTDSLSSICTGDMSNKY